MIGLAGTLSPDPIPLGYLGVRNDLAAKTTLDLQGREYSS